TYSFGIDDHDFVLAFETDDLSDFQELMIKLRSTEASKYIVKDTPMIVSKFENMETIFDSLMG
ncbi:MAG: chlorite dismutase family protein, partial [Nitrososphaerales archaeon]